jgi:hypothetical protein
MSNKKNLSSGLGADVGHRQMDRHDIHIRHSFFLPCEACLM